jgi:RNA recognition motif-containing protein
MEGLEDFTECTLFVGDLSRDVSKDDLYNLFEMVGVVQEAVVKCSNVTGQPMGYGFVRMATRDDAEHALQALAGMNLKGRCIRVGRAERNCRLIVKNLDRSVRFEDLLHIFLPYGSLQMYDSGQEVSGTSFLSPLLSPHVILVNGFCARILHFVRRADAERAKRDLHMQTFHGRPMHVEWYRHTPDDAVGGEAGSSRNEPVVSVHVRFMTVEVVSPLA